MTCAVNDEIVMMCGGSCRPAHPDSVITFCDYPLTLSNIPIVLPGRRYSRRAPWSTMQWLAPSHGDWLGLGPRSKSSAERHRAPGGGSVAMPRRRGLRTVNGP
jgi:hypothetical protein